MTVKNKKILFFSLIFLVLTCQASLVLAGPFDYTPLEKLPVNKSVDQPKDFYEYISTLYKFLVGAAGVCAMLMIVIGGFMYSTSAGNNASMEKAKGVVTDAIIGLLLVFASYLLLYIINPDLVTIKPINKPASVIPMSSTAKLDLNNCRGLATQRNIGLQCGDASAALNTFMDCLSVAAPFAVVNSISDSNGGKDCLIQNNNLPCNVDPIKGPVLTTGCCWHSAASGHYDGNAIDISARDLTPTQRSELTTALVNCNNGRSFYDESCEVTSHFHVNVTKSTPGGCGN